MNNTYSIYNKSTGRFTGKQLVCDEALARLNITDDEEIIEGSFDATKYAIDLNLGKPVEISESSPDDFTENKRKAWEKIKRIKVFREESGLELYGKTFDTDKVSQRNIQFAAELARKALRDSKPFTIEWILKNNDKIELNANMMLELYEALVLHIFSTFQESQNTRLTISQAVELEDLTTIVEGSIAS